MAERKNTEPDIFPAIAPYAESQLKVSEIHTLAYFLSGNPKGKPVLVLHGGPGSGSSARARRFFDATVYHIIQFDQRGCGRSTPSGCLKANTLPDLVADIEKLREALGIDKWVVFGGSWGSTLALAYAQAHLQRIKAIVVYGIFCGNHDELQYFYQNGLNQHFPDEYERFVAPIPEVERTDLLGAYYRRLCAGKELYGLSDEEQLRLARVWLRYEDVPSQLCADVDEVQKDLEADPDVLTKAKLEAHYFTHGCFMAEENEVIKRAVVFEQAKLPGVIVHGRYDMVCPPANAWKLKKMWPQAELHFIPNAGHSGTEPLSSIALVRATEQFKTL